RESSCDLQQKAASQGTRSGMDPDTARADGSSSEQPAQKATAAASTPSEPSSPGRVLRTRVLRRAHSGAPSAAPSDAPGSGRVLRDRSARRPVTGRNLDEDRSSGSQGSHRRRAEFTRRRRSAAARVGTPREAEDEKALAEEDPQKPRRRVHRQKEDKKEKDQEKERDKEIKTEGGAESQCIFLNLVISPFLAYRKKPPVQYVRCEMEGCGTVLAHPRYLQHHIKYQHLLKKKYVCPHPSCGRLFRLQKQLLRHAKHHTDQRDYICEYCARAFKSSHNLAVHRMIHTGEKPLQCEICGFTCRQKASLNWHMKKHDADAFYQFSCSICGKKFEKKDSVVAHKAKSHPEVLIAEALAANAGALITTPAPLLEALPGAGQMEHEAEALPPQQVIPPVAPQAQILTLPTQPVALLPQGLALSTISTLASAPTAAVDAMPGGPDGVTWEGAVEGGGLREEGGVMWERQGEQDSGEGELGWGREGHGEVLLESAETAGQQENHQGLV
ncbi:hypothetical protein Z043_117702, partial [Scleropages formosus]